jgi:hypothetical protein
MFSRDETVTVKDDEVILQTLYDTNVENKIGKKIADSNPRRV